MTLFKSFLFLLYISSGVGICFVAKGESVQKELEGVSVNCDYIDRGNESIVINLNIVNDSDSLLCIPSSVEVIQGVPRVSLYGITSQSEGKCWLQEDTLYVPEPHLITVPPRKGVASFGNKIYVVAIIEDLQMPRSGYSVEFPVYVKVENSWVEFKLRASINEIEFFKFKEDLREGN